MKSFFQRVLPGVFGKAADPQASVIDRSKTVAVTPSSPGTSPAVNPLGQAGGASGIGARRPLISADGAVAGFEFRIGNQMMRRLQGRPDERTQAAHVAAVLTAASWVTQKGRTGVARMPADWLVHAVGMKVGPGVMIALEEPAGPAPQPAVVDADQAVTRQLRENGVKLGWELMSDLGLDPDFVLVRQGSQDMAAMMAAMRAWPAALKGLPVIATDIVSTEDLELALQGGVAYACGALVPRAERDEVTEVKPVPPEVRRIGHLLNQLVTGADTGVIVGEIKGDVGLSYRVLRRLNSARYAQLNGFSIDQAVPVLGRNELYRWLSMMLVQFAGSRKASSALQEIALWRSRLLELLALEKGEPVPGQFFTLGLASLLGAILKLEPVDVVSTLSLPESARQALLDQTGPWHVYLAIAQQLEAHTLEDSPHLADAFGGVARVHVLSDEAWTWAEENTDKTGSSAAPGASSSG